MRTIILAGRAQVVDAIATDEAILAEMTAPTATVAPGREELAAALREHVEATLDSHRAFLVHIDTALARLDAGDVPMAVQTWLSGIVEMASEVEELRIDPSITDE